MGEISKQSDLPCLGRTNPGCCGRALCRIATGAPLSQDGRVPERTLLRGQEPATIKKKKKKKKRVLVHACAFLDTALADFHWTLMLTSADHQHHVEVRCVAIRFRLGSRHHGKSDQWFTQEFRYISQIRGACAPEDPGDGVYSISLLFRSVRTLVPRGDSYLSIKSRCPGDATDHHWRIQYVLTSLTNAHPRRPRS